MGLRLPGPLRWWHLYLLLLLLSHLWIWRTPGRTPPADQHHLQLDGARVAYRDTGDGPPVIYLHGSPGRGSDALRLAGRLAGRYRVLSPDLPGFGNSTRWIPDYSIEAHSAYVLDFMDALEIERAHFIGHSMGTGVAFHIADMAPERVTSIVAYAGIGIQEGEGSGDYYLEHLKYAVGYAVFVAAPEVIPHFGLFGPRAFRHSFIRNFWDTDQRPLRAILERLETPLLILHGRQDPLVPAWTARQHHEIVGHSELVMMETSHFMVFFDAGAARLAEEMLPFLERFDRAGTRPTRRTLDFEIASDDPLPTRLNLDRSISPWTQLAVLAGATFVSEDLTCISAGLLARAGSIDPFVAVLGSFLGIFVSDIWLWGMGRWIGRRVLRWRWVARRIPAAGVDRFGESFDRHLGKAVIASRFLPGTRLPMYVGAGIVSKRPFAFIGWLAVAALIWTPILVLAALIFGPVAARPFEMIFGVGWPSWVAAALLLLVLVRIVALSLTWRGRVRLRVGLSRIWRWEFWPLWLFYLPVLPWIAWLALRHGGLTTPTATNPGQPHGGFVGESKSEILAGLPAESVQPSLRVDAGPAATRVATLREHLEREGWSFPLVLKPDEGQRGAGLKLARGWSDVEAYLARDPRAALAQTYHPGPLEAGIFYYRLPDDKQGRLFSITDKSFPEVTGDGSSTLEELILRHPRLRMQWKVFATRMAGRWSAVPEEGEQVRLAVAGNHCQGTMFLDGERLISPALERSIDAVARANEGFYFGRFDVRYTTEEALRAGRGYRILELNGVTSESTNIYDPKRSLWAAYRTLFRQWTIAFEIGAANRRAGHRTSSIPQLIRAARSHYRARPSDSTAD